MLGARFSWRMLVIFGCGLALLAIGILMFSPLKTEVCEQAAAQTHNNCPAYNVVLVALWKIGEAFSNLTFITALATLAIAAFTGTLWWSTRGLLDATNNTIDLARDEFNATHRAKVRVRRINLQGDRTDFGTFTIFLANAGEADAAIRSVGCCMARKNNGAWLGDQAPNPREMLMSPIVNPALPMGRPRAFPFRAQIFNEAIRSVRTVSHELFVLGEIEYSDGSDIIRTTGFCWVYDHRIRDFRKSKQDEEYNYED